MGYQTAYLIMCLPKIKIEQKNKKNQYGRIFFLQKLLRLH
jgi:hypothetical protein